MIAQYRKKADRLLSDYRHAQRTVQDETDHLVESRKESAAAIEAQKLIQTIAESVQRQAHSQISEVVTRCLKAVFGPDAYDFHIDFRQVRGRTEARLLFLRDGQEVDPTGAAGGGIVDIAALALRVSCLMLARPRLRRVLVLDECFRFLHGDRFEDVQTLLTTLSREMGIQFILTTHETMLMMGKVIEL